MPQLPRHFRKCLDISGNAGFPQLPATYIIHMWVVMWRMATFIRQNFGEQKKLLDINALEKRADFYFFDGDVIFRGSWGSSGVKNSRF